MGFNFPVTLDRRTMISIGVAFLLGGLLTLVGYTLATATGDGNVVAVINGEPLTKETFYSRLEREAGERVLDQLISETLVAQAESEHNVTVTPEQIENEFTRIKENYPTEEAFRADLERYNLTQERLERELHLNLILKKLSNKDVSVTDQEIADYFEQNKESLGSPEQIRVRHILVETEEEAKEIAKELEDGADFAELAQAKSTDTASGAQGGDIGFIQKDSPIVPVFIETAFKLKVDEVSDPVKSQFGWHLIRVDEQREAKETTLDTSRESIKETLINEKSRPVGEIITELRSGATVDVRWPRYDSLEVDPEKSASENNEADKAGSPDVKNEEESSTK